MVCGVGWGFGWFCYYVVIVLVFFFGMVYGCDGCDGCVCECH